MIQIGDKSELT